MDFLDPKKRKAHRIKLLIGYMLMAVALTFATIVLLYQAYGFDFDTKTGQIVQNGLVFLDAHPRSAEIYVNGEDKGRTDQRLDIPSGQYNVELKADGYRTWQRDFFLEGGSIERLAYPFLFPADLKTSDLKSYKSAPQFVTQSPDRRWVVIAQEAGSVTLDLVDLKAEPDVKAQLTLPTDLFGQDGKSHALTLVEWSTDNQHLLVRHDYDGGKEFILIDIDEPDQSLNLSKTFSVPFTNMSLRDKKYDQYYLHNAADSSLSTARLRDAKVTAYQNSVLAFQSHGSDVVIFVTGKNAPEGKALVRVREGENAYTIREIPAGQDYDVNAARFNNTWYFTAASMSDKRVFIFKEPVAAVKKTNSQSALPIAVLRTEQPPQFISFSTNARFIVSQTGDDFSVYDNETTRLFHFNLKAGLQPPDQAAWMDGHRLAVVVKDTQWIFDFDGTNQQQLNAATRGFNALFDPAYEAMYTISPSGSLKGRTALVRTELVVEP